MAPRNFQSSLRDFSSLEFLPRTASWAKFSRPCGTQLGNGVLKSKHAFTARLKLCPSFGSLPNPSRVSEGLMCCPNWATEKSVGSEVAHRVASMLATVRLPNRACGFPAHGFHEDSLFRDALKNLTDQGTCQLMNGPSLPPLGRSCPTVSSGEAYGYFT